MVNKIPTSANKKYLIFLLISTSFFILMLLISFLREDGIKKVWEIEKQLQVLKENVLQLEKENKQLRAEIISLRSDDSYIDRVAREELGLVKSGEVVYKFINKDNKYFKRYKKKQKKQIAEE